MMKKLRWRFIATAMTACAGVVLVLLFVINVWNYQIVTQRQDNLLETVIYESSRKPPHLEHEDRPSPNHRPFESPEMEYMMRYFSVSFDESGTPIDVDHDFIFSVSQEEAKNYANYVIESGKMTGYYKGYRFNVSDSLQGKTVWFLNAEFAISSIQTVLFVSVTVAVSSLLAVFILVFILSKRAIMPYVRNIETQKRFITDASHELKTPLTSISASADVLSMEYTDNEWVNNICVQSAKLSKLISNLVTLSRLDEEQPFPERSEFSLSDAVWEISEPFSTLIAAKGKTYTSNIEDNLTLWGDKNAISQVVSILLDNAVKYSDDGGKIRLDVRKKQRKVEIKVFNTCNISELDRPQMLFERFYRVDNSRNSASGGTGIGLSIAQATVEAHGGTIYVDCKDGKSITFIVLL